VIAIFIVFSVIGVAYLPELKASNVYKYIKPADSLGPDLLGLVPPVNDQLNPHTARAKLEDKEKLKMKIKLDLNYNISQLAAVLPKPNMNVFPAEAEPTLKHNINDDTNNNVNIANNNLNLNDWTPIPMPDGQDPDPEIAKRRDFIRNMMKVSWSNYVTYAWGENELRPVSKKGHSAGIFGTTKLGIWFCLIFDLLISVFDF